MVWAVKRWELKEFTQSHKAGIGERAWMQTCLAANPLMISLHSCCSAVHMEPGSEKAFWHPPFLGSWNSSLTFSRPFYPPVFFALLQACHSFHTCSPPCLNGYSLIIFFPESILFLGLHSPPTQLNLLTPQGLSPFPWPFPSAFHVPQQHSEPSVCRSSRNAEHFQEKSRKT